MRHTPESLAKLIDVMDALEADANERQKRQREIARSLPRYWSDELQCFVTIPED